MNGSQHGSPFDRTKRRSRVKPGVRMYVGRFAPVIAHREYRKIYLWGVSFVATQTNERMECRASGSTTWHRSHLFSGPERLLWKRFIVHQAAWTVLCHWALPWNGIESIGS